MANKKISELDAAGAITGAEVLPLVQGGATKKVAISDLAAPLSTAPPQSLAASAAVGTGSAASREDHRHPTTGLRAVWGYRSGYDYCPTGAQYDGAGFTLAANRLYLVGFEVRANGLPISHIGGWVQSAGTGASMRFGAYAAGSDGEPDGAPLFDIGSVSVPGNGYRADLCPVTVTLPRGLVYLACVSQGSPTAHPAFQRILGPAETQRVGNNGGMNAQGRKIDSVAGALPTITTSTPVGMEQMPLVIIRAA